MWLLGLLLSCAFATDAPVEKGQVLYSFVRFEQTPGVEHIVDHIFEQIRNYVEDHDDVRVHMSSPIILGYHDEEVDKIDWTQVVTRVRRVLEDGEPFDEVHYTLGKGAWLALSLKTQEDFLEAIALNHRGRTDMMTDQDMIDACQAVFLPPVRN